MEAAAPLDRLERPLGVLRLSLTARCNLACPYCLPDGKEPAGLLSMEQRLAVIAAAVDLGAHTLRLTGGEPLLNPTLEALISSVQPLRQRGLREVALTSNGSLLSFERAQRLKQAGLDRLTLSLDGANGASVAQMAGLGSRNGDPYSEDPAQLEARGAALLTKVLAGFDHARKAGFDPAQGGLKLNAVIQRGQNDDQLLPLAELARDRGVELRLIEFMDVGNRNSWHNAAVMSAAEMVERIGRRWPMKPLGRDPHGTASRWRYRDGAGTLAVVASVSSPFCGDCNRLRVTADGIAYTCLFAAPSSGLDLRPWVQPGSSGHDLIERLRSLWRNRDDRYSEERQSIHAMASPEMSQQRRAEMAYLGG
jgi:cyclic pyranopterin phosphate synthase